LNFKLSTFQFFLTEFQTSRISPEAFALFVKELLEKIGDGSIFDSQRRKNRTVPYFSLESNRHASWGLGLEKIYTRLTTHNSRLNLLIKNYKHLRDIQGTQFFLDFETFVRSVKESLFRNHEERRLDAESRKLDLLEKLAKLELSREEWAALRTSLADRREEIKARDYRLETGDQGQAGPPGDILWTHHFAFYKNAENRDHAFFRNLLNLMKLSNVGAAPRGRPLIRGVVQESGQAQGPAPTHGAILIAGGFHTQGLARKFKEAGISYVIVTPKINSIPKNTFYRDLMQGEVSWKNYFKVKNGKVDLYEAFVRGARDKLLGISREPWVLREHEGQNSPSRLIPQDPHLLLKAWRDQIIRDLTQKEELTKVHEYTQFLDEITHDSRLKTQDTIRQQWFSRIKVFTKGLRGLEVKGQLTEQNILKLLKPSTVLPALGGNASTARHSFLSFELLQPEARRSVPRGTVEWIGSEDGSEQSRRAEVRASFSKLGQQNHFRTRRSEVRADKEKSENRVILAIKVADRQGVSVESEAIEALAERREEGERLSSAERMLIDSYQTVKDHKTFPDWNSALVKAGILSEAVEAEMSSKPEKPSAPAEEPARPAQQEEAPQLVQPLQPEQTANVGHPLPAVKKRKPRIAKAPSESAPKKERKKPVRAEGKWNKEKLIELVKQAIALGISRNPGQVQRARKIDYGDEEKNRVARELGRGYNMLMNGNIEGVEGPGKWKQILDAAGDEEGVKYQGGQVAREVTWTETEVLKVIKEAQEAAQKPEDLKLLSSATITDHQEQLKEVFGQELAKKITGAYYAARDERVVFEGVPGERKWRAALVKAGLSLEQVYDRSWRRRSEVRISNEDKAKVKELVHKAAALIDGADMHGRARGLLPPLDGIDYLIDHIGEPVDAVDVRLLGIKEFAESSLEAIEKVLARLDVFNPGRDELEEARQILTSRSEVRGRHHKERTAAAMDAYIKSGIWLQNAKSAYDRGLSRNPQIRLAEIEGIMKDLRTAYALSKQGKAAPHNLAQIISFQGLILLKRGNAYVLLEKADETEKSYKDAINMLTRALALNPFDQLARDQKDYALQALGAIYLDHVTGADTLKEENPAKVRKLLEQSLEKLSKALTYLPENEKPATEEKIQQARQRLIQITRSGRDARDRGTPLGHDGLRSVHGESGRSPDSQYGPEQSRRAEVRTNFSFEEWASGPFLNAVEGFYEELLINGKLEFSFFRKAGKALPEESRKSWREFVQLFEKSYGSALRNGEGVSSEYLKHIAPSHISLILKPLNEFFLLPNGLIVYSEPERSSFVIGAVVRGNVMTRPGQSSSQVPLYFVRTLRATRKLTAIGAWFPMGDFVVINLNEVSKAVSKKYTSRSLLRRLYPDQESFFWAYLETVVVEELAHAFLGEKDEPDPVLLLKDKLAPENTLAQLAARVQRQRSKMPKELNLYVVLHGIFELAGQLGAMAGTEIGNYDNLDRWRRSLVEAKRVSDFRSSYQWIATILGTLLLENALLLQRGETKEKITAEQLFEQLAALVKKPRESRREWLFLRARLRLISKRYSSKERRAAAQSLFKEQYKTSFDPFLPSGFLSRTWSRAELRKDLEAILQANVGDLDSSFRSGRGESGRSPNSQDDPRKQARAEVREDVRNLALKTVKAAAAITASLLIFDFYNLAFTRMFPGHDDARTLIINAIGFFLWSFFSLARLVRKQAPDRLPHEYARFFLLTLPAAAFSANLLASYFFPAAGSDHFHASFLSHTLRASLFGASQGLWFFLWAASRSLRGVSLGMIAYLAGGWSNVAENYFFKGAHNFIPLFSGYANPADFLMAAGLGLLALDYASPFFKIPLGRAKAIDKTIQRLKEQFDFSEAGEYVIREYLSGMKPLDEVLDFIVGEFNTPRPVAIQYLKTAKEVFDSESFSSSRSEIRSSSKAQIEYLQAKKDQKAVAKTAALIELPWWGKRWEEKNFKDFLSSAGGAVYMIKENNQIASFMSLRESYEAVYLHNFAVHPHYDHQEFLKDMFARLKRNSGSRPISTLVRESRLDIQQFFRSQGFRWKKTWPGYFPDTGEDVYEMVFEQPFASRSELRNGKVRFEQVDLGSLKDQQKEEFLKGMTQVNLDSDWDFRDFNQDLRREIRNAERGDQLFQAFDPEGKLIGYAWLGHVKGAGPAEIYVIAVKKSWQRKGIAFLLTNRVIRYLRQHRVELLRLGIDLANTPSLAFFDRVIKSHSLRILSAETYNLHQTIEAKKHESLIVFIRRAQDQFPDKDGFVDIALGLPLPRSAVVKSEKKPRSEIRNSSKPRPVPVEGFGEKPDFILNLIFEELKDLSKPLTQALQESHERVISFERTEGFRNRFEHIRSLYSAVIEILGEENKRVKTLDYALQMTNLKIHRLESRAEVRSDQEDKIPPLSAQQKKKVMELADKLLSGHFAEELEKGDQRELLQFLKAIDDEKIKSRWKIEIKWAIRTLEANHLLKPWQVKRLVRIFGRILKLEKFLKDQVSRDHAVMMKPEMLHNPDFIDQLFFSEQSPLSGSEWERRLLDMRYALVDFVEPVSLEDIARDKIIIQGREKPYFKPYAEIPQDIRKIENEAASFHKSYRLRSEVRPNASALGPQNRFRTGRSEVRLASDKPSAAPGVRLSAARSELRGKNKTQAEDDFDEVITFESRPGLPESLSFLKKTSSLEANYQFEDINELDNFRERFPDIWTLLNGGPYFDQIFPAVGELIYNAAEASRESKDPVRVEIDLFEDPAFDQNKKAKMLRMMIFQPLSSEDSWKRLQINKQQFDAEGSGYLTDLARRLREGARKNFGNGLSRAGYLLQAFPAALRYQRSKASSLLPLTTEFYIDLSQAFSSQYRRTDRSEVRSKEVELESPEEKTIFMDLIRLWEAEGINVQMILRDFIQEYQNSANQGWLSPIWDFFAGFQESSERGKVRHAVIKHGRQIRDTELLKRLEAALQADRAAKKKQKRQIEEQKLLVKLKERLAREPFSRLFTFSGEVQLVLKEDATHRDILYVASALNDLQFDLQFSQAGSALPEVLGKIEKWTV